MTLSEIQVAEALEAVSDDEIQMAACKHRRWEESFIVTSIQLFCVL